MAVRHFTDLIVWQRAMNLVEEVYRITDSFPKREVFGLTNQVRRSAVSIPSNIAEGQGRSTTADFLRYLYIARGSLQEMETQIMLAQRLKYLCESDYLPLMTQASELARILNGLIKSLHQTQTTNPSSPTTDHRPPTTLS